LAKRKNSNNSGRHLVDLLNGRFRPRPFILTYHDATFLQVYGRFVITLFYSGDYIYTSYLALNLIKDILLRISQALGKLWIMSFKPYLGCLLVIVLAFSILGCEHGAPSGPDIKIIEPEDNSSFPFGTLIEFKTSGWGLVHGAYYHTFVLWTISSDVNFSKRLDPWKVDTLSVGSHTITATLTDGWVSNSITVTIAPN